MTTRMPDGHTADLRRHESEQARTEARHDAHGDKARRDIVDALFHNRKVSGRTLFDFCDEHWELIGQDELAAFLLAGRDVQHAMIETLKNRVYKRIEDWLDSRGDHVLAEWIAGMAEDARADAMERRER